GVLYVDMETLYRSSDIISLHCPLTPENKHLVTQSTIQQMKDGVIILNTSRGALIDTSPVIDALKTRKIAGLAIDVYEQEEKLLFKDLSDGMIEDDTLQRLMSFRNVLITAHQAFFTREALTQIASTTLRNIEELLLGREPSNKQAILVSTLL